MSSDGLYRLTHRSMFFSDGFPLTGPQFDNLLLYFLQQREGRSFGQFIKFDSNSPPRVKVS